MLREFYLFSPCSRFVLSQMSWRRIWTWYLFLLWVFLLHMFASRAAAPARLPWTVLPSLHSIFFAPSRMFCSISTPLPPTRSVARKAAQLYYIFLSSERLAGRHRRVPEHWTNPWSNPGWEISSLAGWRRMCDCYDALASEISLLAWLQPQCCHFLTVPVTVGDEKKNSCVQFMGLTMNFRHRMYIL